MRVNALLGAALAIIFFGLALALPNLSSELFYDFTQIETVPQNILRIGLILVGFYFFNKGLESDPHG